MESRSSYDGEKLRAGVRAFEKVIEQREQLCQSGDRLARLFGDFFAMTAAFEIRCTLAIGIRNLQEMAADAGAGGSDSTDAGKQFVPTLNAVRAAISKLMAAMSSSNSAASVAALEEMGVFALCPDPAEQLCRLEGMTANTGSSARLILLVELALFAVELREFDRIARYVAEARSLAPSSWEFYNLCVLEGLLALKGGKKVEAIQWLDKSNSACQLDEHVSLNCAIRAPNFMLAQELLAQGERAAVVRHLLSCKYVWDYAKLPFEKWVDLIERGETPDLQRSEDVQALNQPYWKLHTAWMRACSLAERDVPPPTKPNSKSPAEVLKERKRLVEEQQRYADEIVNRTIKYLDD